MNYIIIPKNKDGVDERAEWGINLNKRHFCRVVSSEYDIAYKEVEDDREFISTPDVYIRGDCLQFDEIQDGDKLFVFEESACDFTDAAVCTLFKKIKDDDVFFIHFGSINFADLNTDKITNLFKQRVGNSHNVSKYRCFPINGRLAEGQYSSRIWALCDELKTGDYDINRVFELLKLANEEATRYWDRSQREAFFRQYQGLYAELKFNCFAGDTKLRTILRDKLAYKDHEIEHLKGFKLVKDFICYFESLSKEFSKNFSQIPE